MPAQESPEVPEQVWTLEADGRRHRVEAGGSVRHRVRWYADDTLVAERRSTDETVRLRGPSGGLTVRFSTLGTPRRATLGGLDLEPAPGSPAAAHEDRVRAHPGRYATLQTAGGVAKVVVPLLLAGLVARLAADLPWPSIDLPLPDLPDLPDLPWPDLPAISWPSIPWPDWSLPDWTVPGWLAWALDHDHYVWPVVLALVLARVEIRRRRRQDELRRERGAGTDA